MTAGLPGVGIGGLFYLISALLMPFVELVRTVRGRSSLARWAVVARQFAMAVVMVLALAAVVWCMHLLFRPDAPVGGAARTGGGGRETGGRSPAVVFVASWLLLTGVLVGASLLRFALARGRGARAEHVEA